MKKLLLIIVCFVKCNSSYAQIPSQLTWPWESTTPSNWAANDKGNGQTESIPIPWLNPSGGLVNIVATNDYTASEGWILLRKDFGDVNYQRSYPYFMLYNKYRSIVRVYVYQTSDQLAHGISITMAHNRAYQSAAILNYTQNIALAIDKYPNAAANDMGLVKPENMGQNAWIYADFPIAFDPKISQVNNFDVLDLTVYANNTAAVSLKGAFDFNTTAAKTNVGVANNNNSSCANCNAVSSFTTDGAKYLDKLPSYDDLKNKVKSISAAVPVAAGDNTSVLYQLQQDLNDFANNSVIGEFLNAATGTSSVLKVISGVFSFFSGTPGTDATKTNNTFAPTVSHGTVQLSGSIDYAPAPLATWSQQVPADGNHGGLGVNDESFFDAPMGILAISNTPKVSVKKNVTPITFSRNFQEVTVYPCSDGVNYGLHKNGVYQDLLDYKCEESYSVGNFTSYSVENNLAVQLNGANDNILKLKSLEACLEAKMKNSIALTIPDENGPIQTSSCNGFSAGQNTAKYLNNKSYDMLSMANLGFLSFSSHCLFTQPNYNIQTTAGLSHYITDASYFYGVFSSGLYTLEGPALNDDGTVDKTSFLIRTPFNNISCLQNTSMTLPEGSSITGIKVRAVFERQDGTGKPVVYMITVKPDMVNGSTDGIPYPIGNNQSVTEDINLRSSTSTFSRSYKAVNTITSVNTISGSGVVVTYTAGQSVNLNPGFDANANNGVTFDASIKSFACGTDDITTVPTTHKFTTTGSSRIGHFDNEAQTNNIAIDGIKANAGNTFSVYPNPFANEMKLQFTIAQSAKISIIIYNSLMQPVANITQSYDAGEHEIVQQMNALPAGIYMIGFSAGDYSVTKKVVKIQ